MGAPITLFWRIFSPLLLLMLAGCEPGPQTTVAEETPKRQFILDRVQFEERREGRILWKGTGRRADGDLGSTDVLGLELVREPQNPNETAFTVRAPRGHLDFDAGRAELTEVRISDPSGSLLTTAAAHYNEDAGTLLGDGPTHFTTPTLVAQAGTAAVWLKTGTVEIHGPVQGQLHSQHHGHRSVAASPGL